MGVGEKGKEKYILGAGDAGTSAYNLVQIVTMGSSAMWIEYVVKVSRPRYPLIVQKYYKLTFILNDSLILTSLLKIFIYTDIFVKGYARSIIMNARPVNVNFLGESFNIVSCPTISEWDFATYFTDSIHTESCGSCLCRSNIDILNG